MSPGSPFWAEMTQLGQAAQVGRNRQEIQLLDAIMALGYSLKIDLKKFQLHGQHREHTCVPIRDLAELMASKCPERLLAGYTMQNLGGFQALLKRFWTSYRVLHPGHPVFGKSMDELLRCIPIKLHEDEGTGLRKTAIYQYSWGPVLPKDLNSNNRYFFWSCAFHEQYKDYHAGYDAGNAVLDGLATQLQTELQSLFETPLAAVPFFLVWVGLEGDLPAQARAMHCTLAHFFGVIAQCSFLFAGHKCISIFNRN